MPHSRRVALAAVLAVLVLAGCTATPQAGSTPSTTASSSASAVDESSGITPVTLGIIGAPLVLPGSDGMLHIDYDVLVSNVFVVPVTLTSLTVRDAAAGTVVFDLSGDALAAVTEGSFSQHELDPALVIPESGQASIEVDATFPMGSTLPTTLQHSLGWSVAPDAPALSILDGKDAGTVDGLEVGVSDIAPVTIRSPLEGDGWWSLQGCCQPNGHRSLRYAIDGSRDQSRDVRCRLGETRERSVLLGRRLIERSV